MNPFPNRKDPLMKAIAFHAPHPIDHPDALLDLDISEPHIEPHDLLVKIEAVSVNPVDVKIRRSHQPAAGGHRILGYDAAGIVVKTGNAVKGFAPGDSVYYAGAIHRPGAHADYQAVDARLVAHMPRTLGFAEAAALPLTTLTAWETLFDRLDVGKPVPGGKRLLLVIGGAGGVGSMAIQLAKACSDLTVIATASRAESRDWCRKLGADAVINHHETLAAQLDALALGQPEFVFATQGSDTYLAQIADLIAAQGRFALIDDPPVFNITPFKSKSVSVHWEFMFTRSLHHTADLGAQGDILAQTAALIDAGRIRSPLTHTLYGLNAANLKAAHALVERGDMIGKVVVARDDEKP